MSVMDMLRLSGMAEVAMPDDLPLDAVIPDDFVISRSLNGDVISTYGDCIWNVKGYSASGKMVYNFLNWWSGSKGQLFHTIVGEMKQIQFARMYHYSAPRKVNSIGITTIRYLAKLAIENNLTLHQLLGQDGHLGLLADRLTNSRDSVLQKTVELFVELYEISLVSGFPIPYVKPDSLSLLKQMVGYNYSFDTEQTMLIPTKCYAALIVGLDVTLSEFDVVSKSFIEFFRLRRSNSEYGCAASRCGKFANSVEWSIALSRLGLLDYCSARSINNMVDLYSHLNFVRYYAKIWIHLFTGMRCNEVRCLPYNTLQVVNSGGEEFYALQGYTSKVEGQNHTPTYWISAPIVEKAIVVAQALAGIAVQRNGWDDSNLDDFPLFPAISQVKEKTEVVHYKTAPIMATPLIEFSRRALKGIPGLEIAESDLVELEEFDGFRDWRGNPKLKIGAQWPLTTHQCRRSLAVYSARSGLVSLGALSVQFKHLTQAMTSYYRVDSIFAKNFIVSDDQKLLAAEIAAEQRFFGFVKYNENVISSAGRLWGGEGNRIQVSRDRGKPLIIATDRQVTLQKFKKGDMVYKESPLGGCVNPEPCEKISFMSVLSCVDCKFSILDGLSVVKIKQGLIKLERSRLMFPPESPFYQQLTDEVDAVRAQLTKIDMGK